MYNCVYVYAQLLECQIFLGPSLTLVWITTNARYLIFNRGALEASRYIIVDYIIPNRNSQRLVFFHSDRGMLIQDNSEHKPL